MNSIQKQPNLSIFNQSGLIDIQFANFGQNAVLEFCSEQGESLGYLVCYNILQFHYVDAEFKENKAIQQTKGFAHYIHHIHIMKKQQHFYISFVPYVHLEIECKQVEILKPHSESN